MGWLLFFTAGGDILLIVLVTYLWRLLARFQRHPPAAYVMRGGLWIRTCDGTAVGCVMSEDGQWLLPYERIDERADRGINRPDWY